MNASESTQLFSIDIQAMISLLKNVSFKDLATHPYRVALFVVAIALGVALVTAMRIATDTVVRHFNAEFEKAVGKADLQVTFGTGEAGFPEEVVSAIREQPYVGHAAAVVRGMLTFADGSGEALEVFGMDILERDLADIYDVEILERTPEDFRIIDDPHGIFLTDVVAATRGLRVGDHVRLAGVTGVHDYTVHGVLAVQGLAEAYENHLAVMYLPAAQAVLGKAAGPLSSNVDQIDVELRDTIPIAEARDRLRDLLPSTLVVSEPEQRKLANRQLVAGLQATLIGISAFALLAAAFIVYATTAALISYRTPTLATLVTVGARPVVLARLVLCEAGALGLVGGVIGTLLGTVMSRFAVRDVAVGMSLNYSLDFASRASGLVTQGTIIVMPLVGMFAAVVSAYVPARRVRALDPLSLQHVSVAAERHENVTRRMFPPALLLGLSGAFCTITGTQLVSSRLCAIGNLLLAVAVILAFLPLARACWSRIGQVADLSNNAIAWLAVGQLNRNIERSLVTVAAISLAIGVVLTTSTLPRSFRGSVSGWYGFLGDAIVVSRMRQGGWLPRAVDDSYTNVVARTRGVTRVDTLRVLQGQEYRGERIAVVGLSNGYLDSAIATAVKTTVDGHEAVVHAMRQEAGLAVSENMKLHYGLEIGDVLALASPTGPVALPIVAVVPDFVSDRGSVLLARVALERRWRDGLVNYFAVSLDAGTTVDEFRRAFVSDLGADAGTFSILSVGALRAQVDRAIDTAFADVDALQLLVVAITIAGIVDLVVSNVLDRRRVHAMLRIGGMTDYNIVRLVTVESGLVGVTAGFIGVLLALLASWMWVRFTYPVLVGYVLRLEFAWANAAVSVPLAAATAMIAGALAERVAMRSEAIDAVRVE